MSLAVGQERSWLRWFAIWQSPFGPGGVRRTLLFAGVSIVFGLLTYGVAYLHSLELSISRGINSTAMTKELWVSPHYAIQFYLPRSLRPAVQMVFEPAHQVDRWIRADLWSRQMRPLTPKERENTSSNLTLEEMHQLEAFRKTKLDQLQRLKFSKPNSY